MKTNILLKFILSATLVLQAGSGQAQDKKPTMADVNQKAAASKEVEKNLLFGLAEGKGREMVIGNCIGCHSPRLIAAQRMDRANWDLTLTSMTKKHGLWTIPPAVKEQILDYLSTHQGPLPESELKDTPWAQPRYRPNPLWR